MGTRANKIMQLALGIINISANTERTSRNVENEEIHLTETNQCNLSSSGNKTFLDLDTFRLENIAPSNALGVIDNFCTPSNTEEFLIEINDANIARNLSRTEALAADKPQHFSMPTNTETTTLSLRKHLKASYCEIGSDDKPDFGEDSNESDTYKPTEDELPNWRCSSDNSSSCGSDSESESPVLPGSPEPELSLEETRLHVSSPDITESPRKKGKKRLRHPESWRKVVRKRLKDSGHSYTTMKGKVVKEKSMKPPCSNRCTLKCVTKFSEASRKEIFDNYWKLASLQRQCNFLGCCIEPLQLKYRRVTADQSKGPRRQNCAFYLTNEGHRIRVYKTFILNTLGIYERTIRTVIQGRTSSSGIVPEDNRGKHGNRPNKIDEEILNSVRNHINSIPRIESHYLRASTSREFIDGGLMIAEMYRQYEQDRVSDKKQAASYNYYSPIFNAEFNIGFFAPKKDQCDTCEAFKNATGDEKSKLEPEYASHQEEKKLSRAEKATDKKKLDAKDSNIVLAVHDLQAVMPVPMGQTSSFFYKSRLNCFNFTVTELKTDQTVCYFWHEGLGNRGFNEIGSCVLNFLEDIATSHPGVDVIFYSDNCGGQQKNRFVNSMYLYAVRNLQIQSITHKYLIRGHTQNEGDAVHSVIEKSAKRIKKSGPVYVPDQYVAVIRNARKKGNPFKVKEMNYTDFFDLKALADEISFNYVRNSEGETIKLADVKMLRFVKESSIYYYKTNYKDIEWKSAPIKILPRRPRTSDSVSKTRLRPNNMGSVSGTEHLKPAYRSKIQIADNKKNDLRQLLSKNIIPKFYESFYNSIC